MLRKQDGQPDESGGFDQRIISRFKSRTNHRVEHPRGHATGRSVGEPHVDHVPLATSRAEGLTFLAVERMVCKRSTEPLYPIAA
jgi:hypothetical protein